MAKTAETNELLTYEQFIQKLELTHSVQVSDPDAVAKSIVQKILDMDDVDQILSGNIGGVVHAEDLLDTPVTVTDVRYNKSDHADGLGFYAICDATKSDGTEIVFSIGSMNAMAQLFRLQSLDALPVTLKIVQSKKQTASGYYPMWLEKA